MEFLIEINNKIYEISELVTKASFTDKLNDGCSKLEFSYVNDDLIIENGSIVRFKYNGANVFYGYVFKVSRDKSKEITVTAYDQLRYCKAKDTIICNGDSTTTLTKKMCNYFSLKVGNIENTNYILPVAVKDDKTWLDIIYESISETLVGNNKKYSLRDEFGTVALRNLENLTTNLILGDGSLAYDFSYEKSIDDDFYNQIKLVSDNESTGKRDVYLIKDSGSINKYGLLQYFEVIDKNVNSSTAKSKADNLLKLYNREMEALDLSCLGDVSIRAGSSFYGSIEDIKLNKRLIVNTVTHKFIPIHTMDLEVML